MKTIRQSKYFNYCSKASLLCCWSILAGLYTIAQVKDKQAPAFEIISRQPVAGNKTGRFSLSAGNNVATYKIENRQGKQLYNIQANGVQALVPALSYVEVAKNGGRIWVYGDSMNRHVVHDAYMNVYSATGSLIKSLGKIGTQPFVAAIADNGALVFAGNSGKDSGKLSNILSLYDLNGNKRWQTDLPEALPSQVFTSPDNRYIAVVLYTSQDHRSRIQFYNASGKLLFTRKGSCSGLEFLPSNKVVICDGNTWSVYDLAAGFKLLHSGALPGVTIGKYPVSAHPSKDIFFVLTANADAKGVNLQAYDANTGTVLAQSGFTGKGYWQPYRQVEVTQDGSIQLGTESEVVTLRMK